MDKWSGKMNRRLKRRSHLQLSEFIKQKVLEIRYPYWEELSKYDELNPQNNPYPAPAPENKPVDDYAGYPGIQDDTKFTYPVGIRKISISAQDPQTISSDDLPQLFYGAGQITSGNRNRYGVDFEGEVYRITLNVVFERLWNRAIKKNPDYQPDESLPNYDPREYIYDTDRTKFWQDQFLADSAARMTDTIQQLCETIRNGGENYNIEDSYIESATPFSEGLSDREMMRYIIATEFYF